MVKRESSLSRKERERARHRREILAAAERIFAAKGYAAATMEEIAREAEFAIGTLYTFFKSKEELYSQVIADFVEQFMAEFRRQVLSQDDPEEALAVLIRLRVRHFEQHRAFIRIAMELSPATRMNPARSLPAELRQQHTHYLEQVTQLFARGIELGRFDDALDPFYLTLALEGVINAFMAWWASLDPASGLEPLERRAGILCRQFLGRIKLRRPAPTNEMAGGSRP